MGKNPYIGFYMMKGYKPEICENREK